MEAGSKQDGPLEKFKLLIVDDDPAVNETLSIIFERRGFEVLSAHNGETALRLLGERSPHIVLLDVGLPDISGIEIAIILRREFPECKFLLLSGNRTTESVLDDAHERGHDFEVLAKPLPAEELVEAVNLLVRQIET